MLNQAIENIEYPRNRKFIKEDSLDILDLFRIAANYDLEITIKYIPDFNGRVVIIRSEHFEGERLFLDHHIEDCGEKFIYDCIDKTIEEVYFAEKRGNRQ